ncbi:EamA domain-containing membrane protein RarD [Filimonas lacunae]|uniref:EamA domain-containing membrane protein RarD n=1 Tax=Filimonas lacunae TaxID=477680 RepID=A0A173MBX8_9BACT|nr:DMT family transporter [Filimonas lacunae]BAV04989.1 permease of the drug/metabolite transporter (DMT) superfamily [Filimonas lacunae]SIT33695.1 EamA domain-containing membrane protein RarD [Filimonas lacunae]
MNNKVKGYLLAIFSAIFYGLIPLFMLPLKAIHFSVDLTLFYRFFISALVLLGYIVYTKKALKVNSRELIILGALGSLFAFSSELLFMGYDLLSPGIASTLLFVYPIMVALIMAFFFQEKLTRLTVLSLFITLCGIFALSIKDANFHINVAGLVVALLCALCYAIYIVAVNKAKLQVPGITISFYSMLFSALFYLCKVLVLHSFIVPGAGTLLHITLFGLITCVGSITALVYAIKLIGSTPTSIMGAVEPVTAVAISVLLFQEPFTGALLAGIVLILTGVLISIIADSKKETAAH